MHRSFLNWHSFLLFMMTWTSTWSVWAQPYPATYQLENPNGGIWANMPYRLYFNNGATIVRAPSEVEVINQKVLHGITDGNGFTSVILLDKLPEPDDVVLIRRVGSGNYGTTMVLTYSGSQSDVSMNDDAVKNKHVARYTKYLMKICNQKKQSGITDKNGQTYYYSGNKNCSAIIYIFE
jgi:hypothetical protein